MLPENKMPHPGNDLRDHCSRVPTTFSVIHKRKLLISRASDSSTPHSWITARMKGLEPARLLSCVLYNTVHPTRLREAIADSCSATGPSSKVDKFESNTSNPVSSAGPQTLHSLCLFFFFQELRLPQLVGQRLKGLPHFSLQWLSRDHASPTPPLPCPLRQQLCTPFFHRALGQELQNPTLGCRTTESQAVALY